MSVDDDGIHATLAADFRPGTDIARRLERVKNTEGSLTAPLPDTTYWVAGGWSLPPGEAWAVVELLSQWAASALDTGGAKPKWAALIDRGLDPVKPLFAAADGSIGVLPGNLRQGLVRGFSRLGGPGGDSQATLAACRAAVERLGAKTVYAPGVREMDGVSLGRFSYDLRGGENDSRQLEADGFFDSLYGRSRESNLGALDSRTVLAALNLVDAETRGAIAAARSSRDPIAHRPGVPAVNARLPRARAAVCYVFLDRMFRSAVTIAREYGLDLAPYRLPPDLPPMGITLCVDGRAARIDAYLPADLLRALERACRQAMRIDEEAP
jgi:hypothetical protein